LLLARVESWLGDLDRALLAVFDAEGYLPEDAADEERAELDRVRMDVEQRKIAQSGSGFGFLPGAQRQPLGGREDLPEDLRRAWRSLFELCDADAGCLCMDGADGGPFEFLEGMTRNEADGLRGCFSAGKIAVIAGFQGIDAEGAITTLGRGGSDTTGVAIAAALDAGFGSYAQFFRVFRAVLGATPREYLRGKG